MILMLIILAILCFVFCWLFYDVLKKEMIGWCVGICGVILVVFDIILALCIFVNASKIQTIDSKISMYQEENTIIEETVEKIIQNYEDYERKLITNLAIMDATQIPELKTNELVQMQVKTYIENNNKIKELKEQKMDTNTTKWLLYFGK